VFEFLRAPSHWNKTDHGLARTSRLGDLGGLTVMPWLLRRPPP
jgi:hypothetical protein